MAKLDAAVRAAVKLSENGSKKALTEFERLLERPVVRDNLDEFERLLEKQFKPKKPVAPPASRPTPTLKVEPVNAPKPKTAPKTAPKLDVSRKKKTGETTKEKGILTLQRAADAVRAILASGQAKALSYAAMVPIVGTAIGLTEMIRGVPDDEAIIRLMREAVLSQKNKRQREALESGKDVMRRQRGTGFDRVHTEIGAPQKPLPAPEPVPSAPERRKRPDSTKLAKLAK